MAIEERYIYLNIQYDRYRQADRRTKGEMLTEMMAVTGMHRKALIHLMSSHPSRHPRQKQRARVWRGGGASRAPHRSRLGSPLSREAQAHAAV